MSFHLLTGIGTSLILRYRTRKNYNIFAKTLLIDSSKGG
ncbi:hypothetical protein STRDD13_00130 [Streptococcus sp. DD13]|nr:hypothetical protein STRDD13_00130 [Streptococcus sp. DD13]